MALNQSQDPKPNDWFAKRYAQYTLKLNKNSPFGVIIYPDGVKSCTGEFLQIWVMTGILRAYQRKRFLRRFYIPNDLHHAIFYPSVNLWLQKQVIYSYSLLVQHAAICQEDNF